MLRDTRERLHKRNDCCWTPRPLPLNENPCCTAFGKTLADIVQAPEHHDLEKQGIVHIAASNIHWANAAEIHKP